MRFAISLASRRILLRSRTPSSARIQVCLLPRDRGNADVQADGTYTTNYQRGYVPRYVWSEPDTRRQQLGEGGHTIGRDDVSTVLTTISSGESELSKRIWDKVLLENTDDVVHVLSLKGLFLYLSPSSRKVLEYDSSELVGTALSSVCHPSDIVPVTRELKDTSTGAAVNVVFRIRRKHSGYTWFESHGSLHTEQGKGRKCIILVGRERPVYALSRNDMEMSGGISDSELWSKMSTSGMFLFVSSTSRSLLDRQPEELVGTSIQALMRPESKIEFGRILEQVRSGKRAQFKHEMQNKRGQILQAQSTIYPGDAGEGQKPTFLVAQTKLLRPSRAGSSSTAKPGTPLRIENTPSGSTPTPNSALSGSLAQARGMNTPQSSASNSGQSMGPTGNAYEPITSQAGGSGLPIGSQDVALASDLNVFDELKTTRSTSWQFELRQMEKKNRILKEELDSLQSARRKRKRRKGPGHVQKECANCHTKSSPEWRRGPSGNRDLCNSCGLRWTKQVCLPQPCSFPIAHQSCHHSKVEHLLALNKVAEIIPRRIMHHLDMATVAAQARWAKSRVLPCSNRSRTYFRMWPPSRCHTASTIALFVHQRSKSKTRASVVVGVSSDATFYGNDSLSHSISTRIVSALIPSVIYFLPVSSLIARRTFPLLWNRIFAFSFPAQC